MARNIEALIIQRKADEKARTRQERVADAITRFTGSLRFIYLHVVIIGLWIVINLGWIPFIPRFDRSFVILAMVASVEAIFLSTFVLITQNRMSAIAERRADLDLQVSLLAEHEVTRVLRLLTRVADKLGLEESHNPELEELSRDVPPEKVLETMEKSEQTMEDHERAAR
jgi:uncharacterized membrane protein